MLPKVPSIAAKNFQQLVHVFSVQTSAASHSFFADQQYAGNTFENPLELLVRPATPIVKSRVTHEIDPARSPLHEKFMIHRDAAVFVQAAKLPEQA
jgi:hypothetical protein